MLIEGSYSHQWEFWPTMNFLTHLIQNTQLLKCGQGIQKYVAEVKVDSYKLVNCWGKIGII